MTSTETPAPIAPARWATPSPTAKSGYNVVHELFRIDAPAAEVAELFTSLSRIRGAHRVVIERKHGEVVDGIYVQSKWFSITFRGTDRAVTTARIRLNASGLKNADRDADHDHASCIARARELGVPPEYAHTPETYLSA